MGDELTGTSLVGPIPWPPGRERPRTATLADLVDDLAAAHGDRPAISFHGDEIGYAALARSSRDVAASLRSMGVGDASVVALLAPNSPQWVAIALGVLRCGAQLHAFNTWVKPAELDHLLRASQAEVLLSVEEFAGNDFVETLTALLPEATGSAPGTWTASRYPRLRQVLMRGGAPDVSGFGSWPTPRCDSPEQTEADRHGALPAGAREVVVYTSGSTQVPKAVPLEQPALIANGWAIGERMHLTREDRVWLGSPLFWSYGVANALMATFTHAACLVLEDRFNPERATATMRRERCTAAYLLPAMIEALRATVRDAFAGLPHLRTGLTIGRPDELRAVVEELGVESICNVYGSTEVYGNCCVTDADDPLEIRMATQGHPLPGVEVRVVDPETTRLLGRDEPGHLQVRGRVMPGYLPTPGEDAAPSPITPDGWYDTGDTGLVREDGRIVFVGRHSELIKTSGINVSPAEIEAELLRHPRIVQAAVVGAPDPKRDEVPIAFVVASEPVSEEELLDHCRRMLSAYKVPARILPVSELPLTSTGKLARKELHTMAEDLGR